MKYSKIHRYLLAGIVMLSLGFQANALDKVRFVMDVKAKAFSLYLDTPVKKAVDIRIEDSFGLILWEEAFQAEGKMAKKFNLKELPDGYYTAYVSDQTKTITQPLHLDNGRVFIQEKSRTVDYKPMIFQKERQLDLNWFTGGMDITITIADANENVILSHQVNEGATLHKRINLEQLTPGSYTLRLSTKKDIYFQEIICK